MPDRNPLLPQTRPTASNKFQVLYHTLYSTFVQCLSYAWNSPDIYWKAKEQKVHKYIKGLMVCQQRALATQPPFPPSISGQPPTPSWATPLLSLLFFSLSTSRTFDLFQTKLATKSLWIRGIKNWPKVTWLVFVSNQFLRIHKQYFL